MQRAYTKDLLIAYSEQYSIASKKLNSDIETYLAGEKLRNLIFKTIDEANLKDTDHYRVSDQNYVEYLLKASSEPIKTHIEEELSKIFA